MFTPAQPGPITAPQIFSEAMGNPQLVEKMLTNFPQLKVWIMHGGAPYVNEAIMIMKKYPNVYTDLSAINFPPILPADNFQRVVTQFIDANLEDRLMFGSDNNDIQTVIKSIENIPSLSILQKEKIFCKNAERFFGTAQ